MALTDETLLPFRGPSVWGESDCILWLELATALDLSEWRSHPTEAHALAAARSLHGGVVEAVLSTYRAAGWQDSTDGDMHESDVLIVDDPFLGASIALVAPGPTLLIRHAHGLTPASGDILHHLTRGTD